MEEHSGSVFGPADGGYGMRYLLLVHLDEAIVVAARVPGARIGSVDVRSVKEVAGLPNE